MNFVQASIHYYTYLWVIAEKNIEETRFEVNRGGKSKILVKSHRTMCLFIKKNPIVQGISQEKIEEK